MAKLDDFTLSLKGIDYRPLMIGGMGVDISTSELALAAARTGAIGHISDAMAPYIVDRKFGHRYQNTKLLKFRELQKLSNDVLIRWDTDDVYQASLKHVSSTMDEKRGEGAVFVNVMEKLTMGSPKETLKARLHGAMDGGIDGITLSAGLHTGTLALMVDNPRFRDVNIGIIVSSARALKLFLRSAQRVERMPDYIVVEGPLAGGHLGFGEDWREHNLKDIVKDVVQLLTESGLDIPVIPAGGIFSGEDALEMINLGAQAVQVATRFTISRECGLPENVKQIYLNAKEEDVEINMTSPTGYPMRMLKYSPSIGSNIKPNCEALGYILDAKSQCQYRDAYAATPVGPNGKKLPVMDKMCICYHFMKHQCYTCGHNVFRLRDTTLMLPDGNYYLPGAESIIEDYLNNHAPQIALETTVALEQATSAATEASSLKTNEPEGGPRKTSANGSSKNDAPSSDGSEDRSSEEERLAAIG